MPSLLRPAVRLLLAALALALLVCWPVLAGAPDGYEMTIVRPDGTSRSPVLTEADDDLVGQYEIRQANGSVSKVDATGGVSVYALLREAGAELNYETVEIPRPGGGTITLTRKAVESSDPRPPGFFKNEETGKTMFVGFPPAGSRQVAARDYFEVTSSGLRITQVGKAEVSVKLKASRTEIDPGERVDFTVQTSPKGSYRYDWTLEPGVAEKDSGSTLSHRFEKEGRYRVVVGVYTSDDDRESDPGGVTIQVGDPKQEDDPPAQQNTPPPTLSPAPVPSSGDPAYTPVPTTPPPSTPSTETPTPPDIATSGTPVEGNLLADVSDPPPSNILEAARRAARDGNPKDDPDDGDVGVSEAAVSIFAALALLGLGAGIETRQGRLPRLRLPRRSA